MTEYYDANGNLTSGGGRTFVWNGWNQLASVSQAGVTETYADDAAGARVTRTSNGATIVTVADLWERTVGGATTHFYRFGADVIGVRRSDQGTQYLFSDHLGSVSAATTASGALVGMQHYDPWGRVRTGGIGLTARTFTGQQLDATGLLYLPATMIRRLDGSSHRIASFPARGRRPLRRAMRWRGRGESKAADWEPRPAPEPHSSAHHAASSVSGARAGAPAAICA